MNVACKEKVSFKKRLVLFELFGKNILYDIGGDGKADVAGSCHGRDVDADGFAGKIHEWAAGVAGIDGRVSLDDAREMFSCATAGGVYGAVQPRNNAYGYGVVVLTKGIADSDDGLTEF